jgi:DNA polymerase-3 subunit delta'
MAGKIVFSDITNAQPQIWKKLTSIFNSGRVGTAYCFSGPPGCGKEGMAIAFAGLMNCENPKDFPACKCSSCLRFKTLQHEHLNLLVPLPTLPKKTKEDLDNRSVDHYTHELAKKRDNPFHKIRIPKATRITLPTIHKLRKTLYLKSALPGRKTAVIFDAELLGSGEGTSANALLKILEEPPPLTTIILVTDFKNKLFPTIISRCQNIQLPALEKKVIEFMLEKKGVKQDKIKWISCLSQGNFVSASKIAGRDWKEIKKIFTFISDFMLVNDHKKLIRFASDYSRLSMTDENEFRFHFLLIQRWLLGVLHIKKAIQDDLTESELNKGMNRFLSMYPQADIREINLLFESVVNGLNRNAHMSLLLTHFIIQLQKELKPKSRS